MGSPLLLTFDSAGLRVAGILLRDAVAADAALLASIYASARIEELSQVPWSAQQKKAFTDSQSRLQEEHYALHYPRAERLVIETATGTGGAGERLPIGRLYIDATAAEVRLMDITLLPAFRNAGRGTLLVEHVLRYADASQRPVSLHVEPFNPARRMYARMGFVAREMRGIYEFMVRPCTPAAASS